MALDTSYTNYGGTGSRASMIDVTTSGLFNNAASLPTLVDGDKSLDVLYFTSGQTSIYIQFYFKGKVILIDEFKFYQNLATAHGEWKMSGSMNGTSWEDIGSSFTLGGSTTQTVTQINSNNKGFKYYRLSLVSGTPSNGPYLREIEFKTKEIIAVHKALLSSTNQKVRTIKDAHLVEIPSSSAQFFKDYGMDQSLLASIDLSMAFSKKSYMRSQSAVLGTGKVFEQVVDINKVIKSMKVGG